MRPLNHVGTAAAVDQAIGVLHSGGRLGLSACLITIIVHNFDLCSKHLGGRWAASVTTYDKQFLLKAVLDGDINRVASSLIVIAWTRLIRHTRYG